MAILGVNGSTNGLWLAVVSDAGEVMEAPVSLAPAADTALEVQIANTVEAASRLFTTHSITRVLILDAEPAAQASYGKQVTRISLEAAVMLAAWREKVPVERKTRASVRSTFKLPRTGTLASHVGGIVEPHPPHWTNKRDLAALVALAARL